jgi:hypothetical protein
LITRTSFLLILNAPIYHAVSDKSGETDKIHAVRGKSIASIRHPSDGESWKPGQLNPNLSWTHYRTLLKVKRIEVRGFYEIESIKNGWTTAVK